MLTLADRILECFSGSGVANRAGLAIDANHDSVGRAFGKLVEQRKLVRVGRGRYEKISGRATISTGSIANLARSEIRTQYPKLVDPSLQKLAAKRPRVLFPVSGADQCRCRYLSDDEP